MVDVNDDASDSCKKRPPLVEINDNIAAKKTKRDSKTIEETKVEGEQESEDETNALLVALAKVGVVFDKEKLEFSCENVHRASKLFDREVLRNKGLAEGLQEAMDEFMDRFPHFGLYAMVRGIRRPHDEGLERWKKDQNTVLRLLLNVQTLQNGLIESIVGWIFELASERDSDSPNDEEKEIIMALPRILLAQLRFLNVVVDGTSLAEHMTELLNSICEMGGAMERLQHEIINFLPEILDDAQHGAIVETLSNLLAQEKRLTVPIIETLANLRIPDSVMVDLRKRIIGILDSAPLKDLPVVIRFLVDSLPTAMDANSKQGKIEVIMELRRRLGGITGLVHGIQDDREKSITLGYIQTCLKTLHSCFVSRPDVGKAYCESLDNDLCTISAKISTMDFWLLVALRDAGNTFEKSATKQFRRHIMVTKDIDESLIHASISNFQTVTEFMFSKFLSLGGFLLSASAGTVRDRAAGIVTNARRVGIRLYQALFEEFSEPYYRQEIIVALVMHCGIGGSSQDGEEELEWALQCLLELVMVSQNIPLMEPFLEFIKTLILQCAHMDSAHSRMVFAILSQFVIHRSNREAGSSGWFKIALRKLLSSPSDSTRIAGAIGAVQFIKATVREMQKNGWDQNDSNQDLDNLFQDNENERLIDEDWQQVFDLTLNSCHAAPQAMTSFCEELAEIVESSTMIPKSMLQKIYDEISSEFFHRFVMDTTVDSGLLKSQLKCFKGALRCQPLFQKPLEGGQDPSYAVNLLPGLAKGQRDPRIQERYVSLCSMFRVVFSLAKALGSFKHHVFLNWGFALPEYQEAVEKLKLDDDGISSAILQSRLYAVNWMREIISSYADYAKATPEAGKSPIFDRFLDLIQLQNELETLVTPQLVHRLPIKDRNDKLLMIKKNRKGKASSSSSSSTTSASTTTLNQREEMIKLVRDCYRPFRPPVLRFLDQLTSGANLASSAVATRTILEFMKELLQENLNPRRKVLFGRKVSKESKHSLVTKIPVTDLLELLIQVLPSLRSLMEKYIAFMEKKDQESLISTGPQGEENEEENESSSNNDNLATDDILSCFEATCSCFHEIVKYALSHKDRVIQGHIKTVLEAFVDTKDGQSSQSSSQQKDSMEDDEEDAVEDIFKFFAKLTKLKQVDSLNFQLTLIAVMTDLTDLAMDGTELKYQISRSCEKILRCSSFTAKLSKTTVSKLLQFYIDCNEDPMKCLDVVRSDIDRVVNEESDSGLVVATMDQSTLAYFYEPVFKFTIREFDGLDFETHLPAKKKSKAPAKKTKASGKDKKRKRKGGDEDAEDDDEEEDEEEEDEEEEEKKQQSDGDGEDNESEAGSQASGKVKTFPIPRVSVSVVLKQLKENVFRIGELVKLTTKTGGKKAILHICIKQLRIYLEKFVKRAMPVLSIAYGGNVRTVLSILRSIQKARRQAGRICDYGRAKKDEYLLVEGPNITKACESFTYSSKQLFKKNNVLDHWNVTSIKAKTLDGSDLQQDA